MNTGRWRLCVRSENDLYLPIDFHAVWPYLTIIGQYLHTGLFRPAKCLRKLGVGVPVRGKVLHCFHLDHKYYKRTKSRLSGSNQLFHMLHGPFRGRVGKSYYTAFLKSDSLHFHVSSVKRCLHIEIKTGIPIDSLRFHLHHIRK